MQAMETAKRLWNEQADEYNQWSDLGDDEKEVLILRQLLREFVDCYFERNYRGITPVIEDACTILDP